MVTLVALWKMVCLEENDMRIRNCMAIFFNSVYYKLKQAF